MPINESNATGYNLRRAQAFAAAGINDSDVRYAHPSFVGKGHGDCSLCGKKGIAWLYAIKFDAPEIIDAIVSIGKEITRKGEVTFNPVGSECIQTWADPLPESKEKLDFLLRWKRELAKCNNAKAVQATNSLFVKLGFAGGTDEVLARTAALTPAQQDGLPNYTMRKALRDLTAKLKKLSRLSQKGAKFLADLLVKAEAIVAKPVVKPVVMIAPPAPPPPPVAPAQPVPVTVDPVLARAEAVLADPVALSRLSSYDANVVKDITAKVKQYKGKFASGRQRSYLEALVKKAETAPAPKAVPVQIVEETVEAESITPTAVNPENFVSASGIEGARY